MHWAVPVPDADASVDLVVHGERLRFKGLGYHDHNWGLTSFFLDVAHTYWGHARVGPYSISFSQALAPNDAGGLSPALSINVAKDKKELFLNCDEGALLIRPWGENSEYPPTVATGPPTGLDMQIDLGPEGKMRLNITSEVLLVNNANLYHRFIGSVEGVLDGPTGAQKLEGKALYEQFKLIPAS